MSEISIVAGDVISEVDLLNDFDADPSAVLGSLPHFQLSWSYSSATNVLEICDTTDGDLLFSVVTSANSENEGIPSSPSSSSPSRRKRKGGNSGASEDTVWDVQDVLGVDHETCILLLVKSDGSSQLVWVSITSQELAAPITFPEPVKLATIVTQDNSPDGVNNVLLGVATFSGKLYEMSCNKPEEWGWYFSSDFEMDLLQDTYKQVAALEEEPQALYFSPERDHFLLVGTTTALYAASSYFQTDPQPPTLTFSIPPVAPDTAKGVVYKNESDEYDVVVIASINPETNTPQLFVSEISASGIAPPGPDPLKHSSSYFVNKNASILGLQTYCASGNGNTAVFCSISLQAENGYELMVVVIDDDPRISAPQDATQWTLVYSCSNMPSPIAKFDVLERGVSWYSNKDAAESNERGQVWGTPISFTGEAYNGSQVATIEFNGLQHHALIQLSSFGVSVLCNLDDAYSHLQSCNLVAGTASTPVQKRNAILEVLMLNGLTGVVSAYAKFLNYEASLPMTTRSLQQHDTLASLWEWLLSFWQRYENKCKTMFVSYSQGTTFSNNDLQPFLGMLSSIDKIFNTLSGSRGSEQSLSTLYQHQLLVRDCFKVFKVIAWFEEHSIGKVNVGSTFMASLVMSVVPTAEEFHFSDIRMFLQLKLPMNDISLVCLYHMALCAGKQLGNDALGKSFANTMQLPRYVKALAQGIMHLDDAEYTEAVSVLAQADAEIFVNQHAEIASFLLNNSQPYLATKYLHSHEKGILASSFVDDSEKNVLIDILFHASQLPLCFSRLHRSLQQGYNVEAALTHLFDLCFEAEDQARVVGELLNLPFNTQERSMLQHYLISRIINNEDHYAKDILVVFLLQSSRVFDAISIHQATMNSPPPQEREEKHNILSDIITNYKFGLASAQLKMLGQSGSIEVVLRSLFPEHMAKTLDETSVTSGSLYRSTLSLRPPSRNVMRATAMKGAFETASSPMKSTMSFVEQSFRQPPSTPLSKKQFSSANIVWNTSSPGKRLRNDVSFAQLQMPSRVGASPTLLKGLGRHADESILDHSLQSNESFLGRAFASAESKNTTLGADDMDSSKDQPEVKSVVLEDDEDDDDEIVIKDSNNLVTLSSPLKPVQHAGTDGDSDATISSQSQPSPTKSTVQQETDATKDNDENHMDTSSPTTPQPAHVGHEEPKTPPQHVSRQANLPMFSPDTPNETPRNQRKLHPLGKEFTPPTTPSDKSTNDNNTSVANSPFARAPHTANASSVSAANRMISTPSRLRQSVTAQDKVEGGKNDATDDDEATLRSIRRSALDMTGTSAPLLATPQRENSRLANPFIPMASSPRASPNASSLNLSHAVLGNNSSLLSSSMALPVRDKIKRPRLRVADQLKSRRSSLRRTPTIAKPNRSHLLSNDSVSSPGAPVHDMDDSLDDTTTHIVNNNEDVDNTSFSHHQLGNSTTPKDVGSPSVSNSNVASPASTKVKIVAARRSQGPSSTVTTPAKSSGVVVSTTSVATTPLAMNHPPVSSIHATTPSQMFSPPTTRLSSRKAMKDARSSRRKKKELEDIQHNTETANLSFASPDVSMVGGLSFTDMDDDVDESMFENMDSPIPKLPVDNGVITRSRSRGKAKSRLTTHAASSPLSKVSSKAQISKAAEATTTKTKAKRRKAQEQSKGVKHGMSLRRSARKKN